MSKQYKDRLFRLVFNDKQRLLELYNALNYSNYEDPDQLEIHAMEDALCISMKNDLSFLIDHVLNLYEHQSTYNPNMPLRGLFYLSDIYRKYVSTNKLNLYGSRLCTVPVPNFLVFYNGLKHMPDRIVLRLSDAFQSDTTALPCMEVEAVMLNINAGHNPELMERCRTLRDYACFVERVRQGFRSSHTLETVVSQTVDSCVRDGILVEFLSTQKTEVLNMLWPEFGPEHIAMEREEAFCEGIQEALLEVLTRLGPIPAQLKTLIENEFSSATLKNWISLSAKAESIEDFAEKAGINVP